MTDAQPDYGEGAAPLTAYERARLRPTVDVAALERFLAAAGGVVRRAVIAALALEVLPEDLVALGWDEPPEMLLQPSGRHQAGRRVFLPTTSSDVQVTIDDPSLAAAWAAVEPGARTP